MSFLVFLLCLMSFWCLSKVLFGLIFVLYIEHIAFKVKMGSSAFGHVVWGLSDAIGMLATSWFSGDILAIFSLSEGP